MAQLYIVLGHMGLTQLRGAPADMDDIRRARLARLGGDSSSSSSRANTHKPSNTQHSDPQPAKKPASAPVEPAKAPQPQAVPAPKPAPAVPQRSASQLKAARIFDLDALLPSVTLPLEEYDSILWEGLLGLSNKLEWLEASWRRLKVVARTSKDGKELLGVIESSLAAYAVNCATCDADEEIYQNMPEWLLRGPDAVFVALVIESAADQELLGELLAPIWAQFAVRLYTQRLKGDYIKVLNATEVLLSNKAVARSVVELSNFAVREPSTAKIVTHTWLGPYLALSPLDPEAAVRNFQGLEDLSFSNPMAVQRIENSMPETTLLMEKLFAIVDKLVRASPDARQKVLDYFCGVLDRNHKRHAHNPVDVSSDGLMANLTYIAIKFCVPFVDFGGSKLDKVDPGYFLYSRAYEVDDETKLVADQETSRDTLKDKSDEAPNFMTQIFFVAVGFLHYGLGGMFHSEQRLKRAKTHYGQQLEQVQATIDRMGSSPQAQAALARAKTQAFNVNSLYLSLSGVLRNETLMTTFYDFAAFVQLWTLHQAQPSFPARPLSFDNTPPSAIFEAYPEYLVESYVATMSFVGQNLPQIARSSGSPIVNGLIFYMECPQFIRNPYLKSQMVEVLFYGALPQRTYSGEIPGYFVELFNGDPMCQEHLFHALMKVYVDMELTGRSAQFYEKFHTRELVSRVMKVLWENPVYQRGLEAQSANNEDFFVKFTALLLNDSTYMLDSALSKLQEIHHLQEQGADADAPEPDRDPNAEEEQQETPGQQLRSAEERARQYLELSSSCVDLLSTFTSTVPAPFTRAEVVDRFASMLNYNLNALVGPKCGELKVKTPEKYNFNPRNLLVAIIRVYLNLGKIDEFVEAVARDTESFGVGNFRKAAQILSKHVLVGPVELREWSSFSSNVEQTVESIAIDEEELGDVPDEYLDPLMATIMKDPVVLPSSKVSMDLTHIKSYLLNTPTDPFNRSPLKIEDCLPNEELKREIQEWLKEARKRAKGGA